MLPHTHALPALVSDGNGTHYSVRMLGRQRADGEWEGRLEFTPDGTAGLARTTSIETTQATLDALLFWGTGLEGTYLEGALARATTDVPEDAANEVNVAER